MKKIVLKILLGSVITEILLICLSILMDNSNEIVSHAIISVFIIIIYLLPCIFYAQMLEKEKCKYLVMTGLAFSIVAMLSNTVYNLIPFFQGENMLKICDSLDTIVWGLFLSSLVATIKSLNKGIRFFKIINIILTILLSIFLISQTWFGIIKDDFLQRIYYILIILTIGSYICTFILTKVYKKELKEVKI